MNKHILNCPECQHRFEFEYDTLPEKITCPRCACSHPAEDYTAIMEGIRCPRIEVGKKKMKVFVDDQLRNTSIGKFEESQVGIYTCFNGHLTIGKFIVEQNL